MDLEPGDQPGLRGRCSRPRGLRVRAAIGVARYPGDQAIYLSWTVNVTLPATTTWTIAYDGPAGVPPSPIIGLAEPTRSYTLTGLTNYTWYTVTLTTDPPMLTDTVSVMPTNVLLYMPLVVNGISDYRL